MRKKMSRVLLLLLLAGFSFASVLAQTKAISGSIADENGSPLAGATISVRNTTLSTSTNESGTFKLDVPENAKILVASFAGKISKEITIGTKISFQIVLITNTLALSDVVVVGYGKAKRANLTTSQTTISSKQIEKTVNTTIEQAIQGRSAGVFVTQNSG